MKQSYFKAALMLVFIFCSTTVWADKQMYARLSGSTLTLFYDENQTDADISWPISVDRKNITHVVFDSSFSEARPTSTSCWFNDFENLQSIDGLSNLNTSEVTEMFMMFYRCGSLRSLDVSNFDTSNVTDFSMTFARCSSLQSLDVSHFKTSNVTRMSHMFQYCSSLTSLDVSGFVTSKVKEMSGMFTGCSSLKSLNVRNFDTSQVTNMTEMFSVCSSLTSLDVSHFNTGQVTDMSWMFSTCSSLKDLDLSNFNTSNVTDVTYMFQDCSSLKTLNIINFDFGKVNDIIRMFCNCQNLKTIYCKADITGIENGDDVFYDCCALKGCKGTAYSWEYDKVYARPDKEGQPGYFTDDLNYVRKDMYTKLTGSDTDKTLTFYYDDKKSDDDYPFEEKRWIHEARNITYVIFDESFAEARPTSTSRWFEGFEKIQSIEGISNLNTSKVTEMEGMFYLCESLTNLDVSNFDTSNVTDMNGMFYGCKSLKSLDVSNFNSSNVTNMSKLFCDCKSLASLNVKNLNTSNVRDMSGLFANCVSLTNLNVSHFNTQKVTNMMQMFFCCGSLTSLDVGNFDTSNVTDMNGMFDGCRSLKSLDVSNFNSSNVTDMSSMFNLCCSLKTINLLNFDFSKVNSIDGLFGNTSMLETIYCKTDLSGVESNRDVFWGCRNLKGGRGTTFNDGFRDKTYARPDKEGQPGYFVDDINFVKKEMYARQTGNGADKTLTFYFDGNKTDLDYLVEDMQWRNSDELTNITHVIFDSSFAEARPTTTACWFLSFEKLQSIEGIPYLNTSNVTNMARMFEGCSALTTLDLTHFDTQNVKNMSNMFYECKALNNLDVSHFNTENVTNLRWMFIRCSSLTSLDLNNFDTSNVTDMAAMFMQCTSLTSLKLSNFNTSNVNAMQQMFYDCTSLKSLDLSHFDTQNVKNMSGMFCGCKSLIKLDLSNFNTGSVTNMHIMFSDCANLRTIYVSGSIWSTNNLSDGQSMFSECTSIVGGNGTIYDPDHVDSEYARIDHANAFGYLTDKNGLIPMEDKEEVTYGDNSSVNEKSDLNGTVIDNVFYNIDANNGGYNSEEKCVVVSKAMTDEEIKTVFGKDLLSDEVKSTFAGMVIEVPAGKGKVTVEAQTTGGMTLKVKIGSADPIEMELEGKLKMKFPYNVTEPTYVYIYAGEASAAGSRKSGSRGIESPSLKIYGISVSTDTYLKGDANGDGVISDADVIAVKDYIMGNEPENFVFEGADANEDGKVNVADIVEIVNKKK